LGGLMATIGGVLGGAVTGWYTLRSNWQSLQHATKREERERGLAFRQQQLSQFYGPVLACMEELEESWQLLHDANRNVERYSKTFSDRHPLLTEKQKALVEYKEYLYAREVAVFSKIKEIFISNFGLAEPSTKENYRTVVRFIENRNIINVTDRKLDITYTGEDSSGLRDRIASLFRNLIDINAQIRSQVENGEPRPITQVSLERTAPTFVPEPEELIGTISESSITTAPIGKPPDKVKEQPKEAAVSTAQNRISRQNWPGRYTLLANKDSLLPVAKTKVADTAAKDAST
jgi:hypothetical protein